MVLKLGIDVGSTHTDAVLLSGTNELVSAVKTKTTEDVTAGVVNSLDLVLRKSGIDPQEIKLAAIGTTHCINAIVERRRLSRVAVIRLALPSGMDIEPMMDWPADLRAAVGAASFMIGGGYEYDGRESNQLDMGKLRETSRIIVERKFEAVAITGQFAPVRSNQEEEAKAILRETIGEGIPISLSHEIGTLGLIERENATILNAATVRVATLAAEAFEAALENRDIDARIFFSQNDGTLMSVEYAKKYPVLTILSGPTNSIRGAGFLTGLQDTVVLDIGGTTTLAGILLKGFPRQSSTSVNVGGVRTNFRTPDLISIGNGGGSVVRQTEKGVTIGPDSVGYNIVNEGIAWGGSTVTTTDVAIAQGYAKIEDGGRFDAERTKKLDKKLLQMVESKITDNVEKAIDMIKTSREPVSIVLVGGGGIIIPLNSYDKLKGVSRVIRPTHFQYANAIGAAISMVSGEVDRVFSLEGETRESMMEQAKRMAVERAVIAGANPDHVKIVDVDEIFLSYLPGNVVRVRIKAAGPLKE